jgi:hypothetical protein
VLLGLIRPTAAQSDSQPLLVEARGTPLSSWIEGETRLERLPGCAREWLRAAPVVSPDGRWAALHTSFELPTGRTSNDLLVAVANVWLCDPRTGQAQRIADQTPVGEITLIDVSSSRPAWSPDGKQLAWVELAAAPDGSRKTQRLIVYEMESGRARVLVSDLPISRFLPAQVSWGEGGLALYSSSAEGIFLRVYSEAGDLLLDVPDGPQYAAIFGWLQTSEGPRLGYWDVLVNSMTIIDPATGTSSFVTNLPELYSPLAPDGITITFRPSPTEYGLYDVLLQITGGQEILLASSHFVLPEQIALAPDGQAAAYVRNSSAFVWRDNQETAVPGTDGLMTEGMTLAWGPTAWRLSGLLEANLG